jgi:hypothetical protein
LSKKSPICFFETCLAENGNLMCLSGHRSHPACLWGKPAAARSTLQIVLGKCSILSIGQTVQNRVPIPSVMGHDLSLLHSHDILRCVRHIPL